MSSISLFLSKLNKYYNVSDLRFRICLIQPLQFLHRVRIWWRHIRMLTKPDETFREQKLQTQAYRKSISTESEKDIQRANLRANYVTPI
jgi:hypothetical protein